MNDFHDIERRVLDEYAEKRCIPFDLDSIIAAMKVEQDAHLYKLRTAKNLGGSNAIK